MVDMSEILGSFSSSSSSEEEVPVVEYRELTPNESKNICPICLGLLGDKCHRCQVGEVIDVTGKCIVAWGVCSHAFHLHCISRWLLERNVCPMDMSKWKFNAYQEYKPKSN